jgi:uncharacterized membrane protein
LLLTIAADVTNAAANSLVYVIGVLIASVYILIAGLIALILFILAMYRLSKYYKEPVIFKNILYSIILTISYAIIISIVSIVFFVSVLTNSSINTITGDTASISTFASGFIAILATAVIFGVLNAFLWWRAFTKLGEKSGVDTFKTVGLLYLLGLVPFIGNILIFVAWLFAAKGFKQLQPQPTPITPNYTTPTTLASFDKIYCSYCGTENDATITYCKHCGNPTQTNN